MAAMAARVVTPIQILPFCYIGGYEASQGKDLLVSEGITDIINCTKDINNTFEDAKTFKYTRIPVNDDEEQFIEVYFNQVFKIIDEVKEAGGRVLIHCRLSISRSPAFMMAYLITKMNVSFEEAWKTVKARHQGINPNRGFMEKLAAHEKRVHKSQLTDHLALKSLEVDPIEGPVNGDVSSAPAANGTARPASGKKKLPTPRRTPRSTVSEPPAKAKVVSMNGSKSVGSGVSPPAVDLPMLPSSTPVTPAEESRQYPVEMHEHIFLGNQEHASNWEKLEKFNIKSVVNSTQELENFFEEKEEMNYFRVPVTDDEEQFIEVYFNQAVDFIKKQVAEGRNVLIHCKMGQSRSVTIILVYLMAEKKLNLKQAYDHMRARRSNITPNRGFWRKLLAHERRLFDGANSFTDGEVKKTKSSNDFSNDIVNNVTAKMEKDKAERDKAIASVQASPRAVAPSEILPYLYLGNLEHSQNFDGLKQCNVKYVINMSQDLPNVFEADLVYLRCPISDDEEQFIEVYFHQCFDFIEKARLEGKSCFVHCRMGMSRSASICIAYLMSYKDMSLKDAFAYCKERRDVTNPNPGFMRKLIAHEKRIFKNCSIDETKWAPGAQPSMFWSDANKSPAVSPRQPDPSPREQAIRESPTQITPYMFLGGLEDSQNKDKLKSLEITNVINMSKDLENMFPSEFKYLQIPVNDDEEQFIEVYFNDCFEFIENARSKNEKVLVHCRMGMSRSATICIAYLMTTEKLALKEAYNWVKGRRSLVFPNQGFMKKLIAHEKRLFDGKTTMTEEQIKAKKY